MLPPVTHVFKSPDSAVPGSLPYYEYDATSSLGKNPVCAQAFLLVYPPNVEAA
jgi:hypothetical protein